MGVGIFSDVCQQMMFPGIESILKAPTSSLISLSSSSCSFKGFPERGPERGFFNPPPEPDSSRITAESELPVRTELDPGTWLAADPPAGTRNINIIAVTDESINVTQILPSLLNIFKIKVQIVPFKETPQCLSCCYKLVKFFLSSTYGLPLLTDLLYTAKGFSIVPGLPEVIDLKAEPFCLLKADALFDADDPSC